MTRGARARYARARDTSTQGVRRDRGASTEGVGIVKQKKVNLTTQGRGACDERRAQRLVMKEEHRGWSSSQWRQRL